MGGHARDLVKVFLCVLECNLCKLRSGWKTVCGCDLNLETVRDCGIMCVRLSRGDTYSEPHISLKR